MSQQHRCTVNIKGTGLENNLIRDINIMMSLQNMNVIGSTGLAHSVNVTSIPMQGSCPIKNETLHYMDFGHLSANLHSIPNRSWASVLFPKRFHKWQTLRHSVEHA